MITFEPQANTVVLFVVLYFYVQVPIHLMAGKALVLERRLKVIVVVTYAIQSKPKKNQCVTSTH